MSAPGGAPSPAPRSASIGPGGGMPMPPQQPMPSPQVGGGTPGSATGSTGVMSQQNLNQIAWVKSGILQLNQSMRRLMWKDVIVNAI
ncbi:hypothetical protein DTO166G4_3549 [Paecilomyces variotii]|nr:hypothetical protein DTO166G4_3549 [Paecilomyces variotii]KAJ9238362.1 hypothetical protein DTO166G5_2910 [Paecilomyces variotii]KAJ9254936.1 hypothetical protein DTO195F2_6420 [Paecilomyces variotii]KAJ9353053.1 hypothetical protein DTO280E4_7481 [Paecilomyces variotii]